MRKIQLGVALFALFAFGVLTATSAMGSTTLLALWLLNGAAIASTETNLVEIAGELLLADSQAILGTPAMVLCSVSFDGWVGGNSLDYVTEVLNSSLEAISTTPLSGLPLECTSQEGCETTSKPDVWPVGLPWESEVELLEQEGEAFFADYLTKVGGGKLGWEITNCLALGITREDECTTERGAVELQLEGATLLGVFSTAFTELTGLKNMLCTAGNTETGVVEGEGTFLVAGGGELTASSEASEA